MPTMSAMPMPDHLLSLDEWAAIPEDTSHHYELIEGVLQVSPRPASDHQWAAGELGYQLRDQLPGDLKALAEIEVVLRARWPATVRVPDLAVVRKAVAVTNPARYLAEDVLLAVEVISPGSRERDEVTKMYEYSEAGIADYWVLDLDGEVTMTAYRLVDGEYEVVGKGGAVLELSEPAPLAIDVAALLPHRR
jgi:Uma2 family endonuclease